MWIVEGLADDRIGFIAKMHHSTVDGVSGAALLSVLFDLEPEPPPVTSPGAARSTTRIPSGLELMSQAMVARTLRPSR
jgi:diacylglycerol O-acyltransferase